MRAFLLASLALGASIPACLAELDLIPKRMSIGGGLADRAYFTDGSQKFAVTLDAETQVSEEDGGAVFRFANLARSSFHLAKSPLSPAYAFTPENRPAYFKAASGMIARSAEGVTLTAEVENPFPINGWTSRRFQFSYVLTGARFIESVTFLNLDSKQQIVIRAVAPEKDFPVVAARADDIFRRWHEVLPGDELGLN